MRAPFKSLAQIFDDQDRVARTDRLSRAHVLTVPVFHDELRHAGLLRLVEFQLRYGIFASAHQGAPDSVGHFIGNARVAVAVRRNDDVPIAAVVDKLLQEVVVDHVVAVGGVAVFDLEHDDVAGVELLHLFKNGFEITFHKVHVLRF